MPLGLLYYHGKKNQVKWKFNDNDFRWKLTLSVGPYLEKIDFFIIN